MRVLFRTDAGPGIGLGHLMRCLALAQAWRDSGGEARFLTASADAIPLVHRYRFDHEQMNAVTGSTHDAEIAAAAAARFRADWVVLDGYAFAPEYQRRVGGGGWRVLLIDDMAHQPRYHSTAILNQNLDAHLLPYAVDPETVCLFGPQFALLRKEFVRWRGWGRAAVDDPRHILVTMGGADALDTTRVALEGLKDIGRRRLQVTVVVGAANPRGDALREAVADYPHAVRLIDSPPDMSALMAEADIAIAAAGSTAWETAFMGLPTAFVRVAENQRGIQAGVVELGCGVSLGDAASLRVTAVTDKMSALLADRTGRLEMSRVGRALVDGRGAKRVVAALGRQRGCVPRLRPVASDDICLLWQWANDPAVRSSSLSTSPIPWSDHRAWFLRKLASPDSRMWVLEVDDLAVGVIRVDRERTDTGLISYAVAPGFRGRGYGTELLRQALPLAIRELHLRELHGVTLEDNGASRRAFEKAGFAALHHPMNNRRPSLEFRWTDRLTGE